jgi:hypothetical protein
MKYWVFNCHEVGLMSVRGGYDYTFQRERERESVCICISIAF